MIPGDEPLVRDPGAPGGIYRVRREALTSVAPMLEQMWTDALWRLKLKAELAETRRGPKPLRRSRAALARRRPRSKTEDR